MVWLPNLHVDNLVVSVVTDLNVLQVELGQDALPVVAVDEGGRVHDATVRNDKHVLGALLRHGEIGLLQRHHGHHQVLLEVEYLQTVKM